MLTSTIIISGVVVLGALGIGYYLINSKSKNKESKKEVNIQEAKPYEFNSKSTPTYNPIQNSTTKLTSSHLKRPTTAYRNNHSNDTSDLLDTIIAVEVIDSLSDNHKHSHYSTPSYESHSYESSYNSDSYSSYDSGGSSCDSGSCDCGGGCD